MAITVINLTDPVSSLVTKTNTISGDLGDVDQLLSGDSNAVDAINQIFLRKSTDSAQVISLARSAISGDGIITYDSANGIIGLDSASITNITRRQFSTSGLITFDSATDNFDANLNNLPSMGATFVGSTDAFIVLDGTVSKKKIANTIPVTVFSGIGVLNILDTDGTTLSTIYKSIT